MVPSPARYIAIAKPESCHVAAITIGIIATGMPSLVLITSAQGKIVSRAPLTCQTTAGSVIQPGLSGPTPAWASAALRPTCSKSALTPVSGLKIQRQTTPVVMNEMRIGKEEDRAEQAAAHDMAIEQQREREAADHRQDQEEHRKDERCCGDRFGIGTG